MQRVFQSAFRLAFRLFAAGFALSFALWHSAHAATPQTFQDLQVEAVRGVELSVGDGYVLKLKDGSEVEVSRRQARELREHLAL
ncbi:LytTR family transcriptional regulator [Pyxidicoccus caerfyrddinensis]|uniref:LytTR family transcriptional regulator n=1 Tax=Pyxidicoccus caerfyrddinensis TaxID=2709663 RepID=UPI001966D076|nr:LytTR family transcriptional regulator [Pyxidicoccus caerfyrddinensis]